MDFPRQHHFKRRDRDRDHDRNRERPFVQHDREPGEMQDLIDPEHTGAESDYLKSLVDSRANVTVVLKTGERLQGRIRYYDRYCFSIGLSAQGPRLFLRKASEPAFRILLKSSISACPACQLVSDQLAGLPTVSIVLENRRSLYVDGYCPKLR